MTVSVLTYKCGLGEKWWTYAVWVNGNQINLNNVIYRMYSTEKTAMKNGQKILTKHLEKYFNQ